MKRMLQQKSALLNQRKSLYFQFFAGWGDHLFFQTKNGVLFGCGKATIGQLSLGKSNQSDVYKPVRVSCFKAGTKMQVLTVSLGRFHSLFLTKGCGAFSSGSNEEYQLSDSTRDNRYLAVKVVLEDEKAVLCDVVCGHICSYFISDEGKVFSVGRAKQGQLGHGRPNYDHERVKIGKMISELKKVFVVEIVTGNGWAIFRSSDSSLFCCGSSFGQFGLGGEEGRKYYPTKITFFKQHNIKIDFLVSSRETAYFITSRNLVYSAGTKSWGQFGDGDRKEDGSDVPVLCPALSNFEVFCTGNNYHFLVFKKNGKMFGVGHGCRKYGVPIRYGRINFTPVEIGSLEGKDVKQIVTRYSGTYAICADGSVYCAGQGSNGELMSAKQSTKTGFEFAGKFRLMRTQNKFRGLHEKQQRLLYLVLEFKDFNLRVFLYILSL